MYIFAVKAFLQTALSKPTIRDKKRKMGPTRYCTIHLNNCDLYLTKATVQRTCRCVSHFVQILHNIQSALNQIPLEAHKGQRRQTAIL